MRHPTFRCSVSVAQPGSAVAQCCTQQFGIFLHNLFHSYNHISIAPDSSVMRGELSSTRAGWVKVANDVWIIHLDTETEEMVLKYCPNSSQPGKWTSLHVDDVIRIPVECDATQVSSKLWHLYFQWQPEFIQRKYEHGNARFLRQSDHIGMFFWIKLI